MTDESVNHPKHYTTHPSGIECIVVVEHFNFNVGNAVKYLWRAGLKGDQLEDLKKHDGCEYFVLDLTLDKHAKAALEAYAVSCADDYPVLASDLRV